MHVIGLTGGIASGKSTVARLLADLGATAIDADRVVHELQEPGQPVYRAIVAEYGPDVLAPDGRIDRTKLGAIVFAEPDSLSRLEEITHPPVIEEVDRRVAAAREAGAPAVVVEAVKLVEADMHRRCDSLWIVTCDATIQEARLVARGHDPATVRARLAAQPDIAPQLALADVVIENSGSLEETKRQVEAAWRRLVKIG